MKILNAYISFYKTWYKNCSIHFINFWYTSFAFFELSRIFLVSIFYQTLHSISLLANFWYHQTHVLKYSHHKEYHLSFIRFDRLFNIRFYWFCTIRSTLDLIDIVLSVCNNLILISQSLYLEFPQYSQLLITCNLQLTS